MSFPKSDDEQRWVHTPNDEVGRLDAVHRYRILDTPADGTFDHITALAAELFEVPIALVTIVDNDRIWFASNFGLPDVAQISRDPGLCASVICQDSPYVVENARMDPRTLANPLVAGDFGMQFYAAAPLMTGDGHALGTICVIDREPRQITLAQTNILTRLASIVVREMELRLVARRTVSLERQMRETSTVRTQELAELFEREREVVGALQSAFLPRALPNVKNLQFSAMYEPAVAEERFGGDWYAVFSIDENRVLVSVGDVTGHGLPATALMGKLVQSLRALALIETSPYELLQLLDALLRTEEPGTMVTTFVGVIDAITGRLEYANAGHSTPIVRFADGRQVELKNYGVALGLRAAQEPHSQSVTLQNDSLLVLYTDGLTEATRDVIQGEQLVHSAIRSIGGALPPNPARAIADFVLPNGTSLDDVAVLTVHYTVPPER